MGVLVSMWEVLPLMGVMGLMVIPRSTGRLIFAAILGLAAFLPIMTSVFPDSFPSATHAEESR